MAKSRLSIDPYLLVSTDGVTLVDRKPPGRNPFYIERYYLGGNLGNTLKIPILYQPPDRENPFNRNQPTV
jgi:hypothetical protein